MKTQVDLVDNLGATIEEFVSDPETTTALANPSIGERSDAPDEQLLGRDNRPSFADWYGNGNTWQGDFQAWDDDDGDWTK